MGRDAVESWHQLHLSSDYVIFSQSWTFGLWGSHLFIAIGAGAQSGAQGVKQHWVMGRANFPPRSRLPQGYGHLPETSLAVIRVQEVHLCLISASLWECLGVGGPSVWS